MIPAIINDTGDCCCQCPPSGPDGWCHCNDDYNGKGDDIENAITCDLVWTERQPNGRKKYFKVVSGSSQQNMPVVLPTASLTKRGVVQLTNDLSDREDLALTPKGAKGVKEQLDRETADRVAKDTDLQNQINKEKTDRANADADLLSKINQEKADRANADNALSNRITSVESKADNALSKANNSVTSVTSNGNATVTVTKTDGTSNSFTINNVAHATSADNATHATNANHATVADNATHATNADTATNADHALIADRLASGSETGSSTTTYNYKKYILTTAFVQKYVDAHTIRSENIGNGNYHITYQYSFDVTFTFPKQIGKASNIIVDAINLVVTHTGQGVLNKLTTKNVIGGLEFGTSTTITFTFYGPEIDTTTSAGPNAPTHAPIFVQGNIVVYVNDRTNVKVED